MSVLKKISWIILQLACIGTATYALYFIWFINPDFSPFKAKLIESPLIFGSHIIAGSIALYVCTFVMSKSIRKKYLQLHRYLGRIYVVSVFISALSGFIIAFSSEAGSVSLFGFTLLSTFWFYSTYMGYKSARNKDIAAHELWMTRSFILTMAAVLLRIELGLLRNFTDYSFIDVYGTTSFISWVPTLIIAEWFFLHRTMTNRDKSVN